MQSKSMHIAFLLLALAACAAAASAQTSVALNVYGAFSGTSNGNGIQQSPANQAGGLFELRHISNPILGFEATYSFNRADQTYSSVLPLPTCAGCTVIQQVRVPSNADEITADWTPSLHFANLRPFGILGVGLLLNVPSGTATETVFTTSTSSSTPGSTSTASTSSTSTSTKAVYVYGAGLDWGLLPHLGLRFQYRGNLYQAPNLSTLYTSTGAFTHTAEPMIGAYFNF